MTDLVRAVLGDFEKNVGRAYAEAKGLKILDEPTHVHGNPRRPTRKGRPAKPKTSVAAEAAKKKTSARSSAAKKTEPTPSAVTSEPAPNKES